MFKKIIDKKVQAALENERQRREADRAIYKEAERLKRLLARDLRQWG